ncbi:MAG: YlxR family protein, partial [Tsuneonella troitsensis]
MRTPNNERLTPDIAKSPSRLREGSGVGQSDGPPPVDAPTAGTSRKREGSNPERKCILSGEHGARESLVRLAISPDGLVLPDIHAKAPGRGAWLAVPRGELETAMAKGKLKGALARAFKGA